MFNVVLYQPEIPANAGNVVRLCANTGCRLHLVHPLGFVWDDRRLRRAGLDYHEFAAAVHHASWAEFRGQLAADARLLALTTRGAAAPSHWTFDAGDWLVFGPETRGLPETVLDELRPERRLRLPMVPQSRSLNLSNSVAATVYEGWRQLDYRGAA